MLNDLKELIAIPSLMGKPLPGQPFGKECYLALKWFVDKARSYGLKAEECEGYCGYAEYGEGDLMGILCHLDVVPVGDGWSTPPFSLVNENGYLYGRGVVDNKGPAVVALHVLKTLKEQGVKLNHRVRVIVGCNEENGSLCMKYYHDHCEIPKFNFVPDSDFPIINSEKGIAHIQLSLLPDSFFTENFISLSAGVRANVVPDLCVAHLKKDAPLGATILKMMATGNKNNPLEIEQVVKAIYADGWTSEDFSAHIFEDKIVLETRGIAGHAMAPHKCENAFWKMITLLEALKGSLEASLLQLLKTYVATPLAAERIGVAASDEDSGDLTMNAGVIALTDNLLNITLDFRLPISQTIEVLMSKLAEKFPAPHALTCLHWAPNLFIDKENKLIKTLLGAYTSVTGDEGYCIRCGGGTYARELPNSVAFGPTFPGAVTNIHNIDECISVNQFNKLYDIYLQAVLSLDKSF